jgi:hypothetical protein
MTAETGGFHKYSNMKMVLRFSMGFSENSCNTVSHNPLPLLYHKTPKNARLPEKLTNHFSREILRDKAPPVAPQAGAQPQTQQISDAFSAGKSGRSTQN